MQWTATGLTRPKRSMPPSRKHHNRIRDLVLQSAGRLFNRHGFNAVSIDDVMAEAGLTRGSFYCYFSSKSDLYAQSVARVVHEDRENPKGSESERTRADKIVHDYLSEADQDTAADTFPMIGLPNDISRTDRAVRQAFEAALKLMIQSFEQAANGNADARRANALAIAALCVGGMVLSRSIDDRKLADDLRGAAKATALNLGKW
jgi:TetR/AcrR family transcriptional regulator, transcriptional repressor for nem operon